MEKQTAAAPKPKHTNILKFLPKAVSFQNPPFSPAQDNRHNGKLKKRFHRALSGPISYMIPSKSKNFESTQEPTSPKISCIGQIKHKHKIAQNQKKKNNVSLPKELKPASGPRIEKNRAEEPVNELKKKQSGIKKIFGGGRKSDASIDHHAKPPRAERTPSLSQLRRFASTRETFANFDWTTAEDGDFNFKSDYCEREDDVIIPFSAPILASGADNGAGLGLEPRKEINLWKRRTMAQPKPLKLNLVGAQ